LSLVWSTLDMALVPNRAHVDTSTVLFGNFDIDYVAICLCKLKLWQTLDI